MTERQAANIETNFKAEAAARVVAATDRKERDRALRDAFFLATVAPLEEAARARRRL